MSIYIYFCFQGNGQQQILLPDNAQIVRLPGGGMQIIQPAGNQQLIQHQSNNQQQHQVILVSRQNNQVNKVSQMKETTKVNNLTPLHHRFDRFGLVINN